MTGKPTDWKSIHSLVFGAMLLIPSVVESLNKWPLFWLIPLLCYGALTVSIPALRRTATWLRVGRISKPSIAATAGIILATSVSLLAFQAFIRPDLRAYREALPLEAFGGFWIAAIFFPLLNATIEELVYRGVLYEGIESQWGTPFAIVAIAVLFGVGHLQGYPPGGIGVVMAGIYGVGMAGLRAWTGGLALPIAAHVFADATIYAILARERLI